MKYEGSRTGRFEISQVPIKQVRRGELSCSSWCLICVDIQRNSEQNPSMNDMGDPCDLCPDCSGVPDWTT